MSGSYGGLQPGSQQLSGSQAVPEPVKASPVDLALGRLDKALALVLDTADRLSARMDRAGVLGPPVPSTESPSSPKGDPCTLLPDKLDILTRRAEGSRELLQDCLDRALI